MDKCPYHPEEDSHTVKIDGTAFLTCPECEWNPPDDYSDTGFTNPEIKTMGWEDVTG